MKSIVRLYSNKNGEILKFLNKFNNISEIKNDLEWEKEFENPVEIADIIGAFIENTDDFKINMWISLDENLFINITPNNADEIIRYLYERYPW